MNKITISLGISRYIRKMPTTNVDTQVTVVQTKSDKNPYTLSIIIVIVFLAIIIFVVVWLTLASIQDTGYSGTTPLSGPQGLDYRCSTFKCGTDTTCDSVSQLCKLNLGQPCISGAQCLSGSFCSGVCTDKTPAYVNHTANSPCPCPETMTCVNDVYNTNYRICKKKAGIECDNDGECLSDQCLVGVCSNGKALGQPCTTGSTTECVEGTHCSTAPGDDTGFCQNEGTETGSIGAYCNLQNTPGCDTSTSCLDNKCVPSAQGLTEFCIADQVACSLPLTCVNDYNFQSCATNDVSCICVYPYNKLNDQYRPKPNSCSQTGTCSGAPGTLTCQANSDCVGIDYFPCTTTSQCASGSTCSIDTGGISILSFDYYTIDVITQIATLNNSTSPLHILSSTNMYYNEYSSRAPMINITNNVIVDKLVGYSDKVKDYVYYLIPYNINDDRGFAGLYTTDVVQVIPGYYAEYTSDQTLIERKLLDVALNSDLFFNPIGYALFEETWTSTDTTTITNNTVYTFNPVTLLRTPYSPYTGSGLVGTQYISNGTALAPTQIIVSSRGDIALAVNPNTSSSTIYIQSTSNDGTYQVMTNSANDRALPAFKKFGYYNTFYNNDAVGTNSPPCGAASGSNAPRCLSRYDITFSAYNDYIYNNSNPPISVNVGKVVVFNGAASGAIFPYYQYSDPTGTSDVVVSKFDVSDYSLYTSNDLRSVDSDGEIIVLNDGYSIMSVTDVNSGLNMVCIVADGIIAFLPGYVGPYTKVLALRYGSYLYSQGSCSSV